MFPCLACTARQRSDPAKVVAAEAQAETDRYWQAFISNSSHKDRVVQGQDLLPYSAGHIDQSVY